MDNLATPRKKARLLNVSYTKVHHGYETVQALVVIWNFHQQFYSDSTLWALKAIIEANSTNPMAQISYFSQACHSDENKHDNTSQKTMFLEHSAIKQCLAGESSPALVWEEYSRTTDQDGKLQRIAPQSL